MFLRPLEKKYQPLNDQNESVKLDDLKNPVIVILAGGMVDGSPASGSFGSEIGEITLARLYGGYKIYQQRNVDIWVSGGIALGSNSNSKIPIAQVMKEVLISWGVKPNEIILEEKSRTTLENAENILEIMKGKEYQEIILITSALHMKRSLQSFQNEWLRIIPAPVNYIFEKSPNIVNIFPNSISFNHNSRALHEWIGLIYYSLGLK
ncbi:MAG: YdcF family protein [Candidatus Bathyarchaeota archaeon]|nr:YdcF family protein [Candidatus Bathyarchaeota archaeon]